MEEIWKDIEGYEGLYQVSNMGNVRSLNYNQTREIKVLKPSNNRGYKLVVLSKNGKSKTYQVHRLVALHFIPNPNSLSIINHKNEDKTNNCVDNLEWCTIQYNNAYGTHNERNKKSNQINNGKRIKAIKDNKEQIFISVREAGRQLNLNYSNIFSCLSGKLQHTGGYAFKEVV